MNALIPTMKHFFAAQSDNIISSGFLIFPAKILHSKLV